MVWCRLMCRSEFATPEELIMIAECWHISQNIIELSYCTRRGGDLYWLTHSNTNEDNWWNWKARTSTILAILPLNFSEGLTRRSTVLGSLCISYTLWRADASNPAALRSEFEISDARLQLGHLVRTHESDSHCEQLLRNLMTHVRNAMIGNLEWTTKCKGTEQNKYA